MDDEMEVDTTTANSRRPTGDVKEESTNITSETVE